MANIFVRIAYDTAHNSRSLRSYSIDIGETDRAPVDWTQIGPVYNDRLVHEAVFPARRDAIEALLARLDFSCKIVEFFDCGKHTGYGVRSLDKIPHLPDGISWRILGTRNDRGVYIAHD